MITLIALLVFGYAGIMFLWYGIQLIGCLVALAGCLISAAFIVLCYPFAWLFDAWWDRRKEQEGIIIINIVDDRVEPNMKDITPRVRRIR